MAIGLQVQAQRNFTLSQDTLKITPLVNAYDTTEIFENAVYVNTVIPSITLSWKVLAPEMPTNWKYQVCDRFQCYGQLSLKRDSVKTSPEFDADTSGLFKPGIRPRGFAGQATMKIIIWDENNTSDRDTLLVIFDAILALSPHLYKSIDVFPNPAYETVSLEMGQNATSFSQISAIDILGQSIPVSFVRQGSHITVAVEALNHGTYVLQAVDSEGTAYISRFTKL